MPSRRGGTHLSTWDGIQIKAGPFPSPVYLGVHFVLLGHHYLGNRVGRMSGVLPAHPHALQPPKQNKQNNRTSRLKEAKPRQGVLAAGGGGFPQNLPIRLGYTRFSHLVSVQRRWGVLCPYLSSTLLECTPNSLRTLCQDYRIA